MKAQLRILASFLLVLSLAWPHALAQTGAAGQLRGILLDSEGLPAEGFQISAMAPGGDLFNSTMTRADGSFVIPGLPPGEYELVALAPDGSEFPIVGGTVAIAPGETERLELRIAELGGAPGRDPEAVRGIQEATDSDRAGGFWSSSGGRVVLIVGGVAAAGLIYAALDDDDDDGGGGSGGGDDPSPSTPE